MSLETLRQMRDYYKEQDRATDSSERDCEKQYASELPADQVETIAETLFQKALLILKARFKKDDGRSNAKVSQNIDIKPGTPKCVTQALKKKFESINLICSRHHNYGYNFYDWVTICPPEDFFLRIK